MPDTCPQTEFAPLGRLADIRVSNVDKKTVAGELPVRLCNYTDVYNAEYLTATHPYMHASATYSEIQRFAVQVNDVIITKDSETPDDIGVAAVIDEAAPDLVCGYHLAMIRPSAALNPVWLSKQFGHARLQRHLSRVAAGTTRYGLSNGAIASLPIFVPPRAQQDFAAAVLRTLDETIRKTEQLIAKLQQAKQGLLHDLLTRGIDDNGELRDPERDPGQFKNSVLGLIPRDWGLEGLESYLASDGLRPGPFGSSITKSMYVASGFRVYGQEQVIAGSLDVGNYYITRSKYAELTAFSAQAGDILISLVGTVGRALVIREPFEAGVINPRLMRLRPDQTRADVEFLKHLLVSWFVRDQLERRATGGTMAVLNSSVMRSVCVPVIPRREQTRIADILDTHELRVERETASLGKLRALKSGLMDDLLTGRVRGPTEA